MGVGEEMNITCTKCKVEKPEEEFGKVKSEKNGKSKICKECRNFRSRELWKIRDLPKEVKVTSTHRLCNNCKEWKLYKDFGNNVRDKFGITATCRKCMGEKRLINKIMKRPLPMFQTHKKCPTCSCCLPVEDYYLKKSGRLISSCKSCIILRCKKYNEDNKEKVAERVASYYVMHKEDIREKQIVYENNNRDATNAYKNKFKNKKAKFSSYGKKLLPCDNPTDVDGMLLVSCKHCGSMLQPTNAQCHGRVQALSNNTGRQREFYCSDKCKQDCDVFNTVSIRKSERPEKEKSRNKQKGIKKKILETQCKEEGYNYCEKCGDILDVDIHHTWPLSDFSIGVDNPDTMLLLCPGCHTKLHRTC